MVSQTNVTASAGRSRQHSSSQLGGLERLREEMGRRRTEPFLVTVTPELRPHCGPVTVDWDATGEHLVVTPAPSGWISAETGGFHHVTVLWPPGEAGGYSLIVDGTGTAVKSTGTPVLAVAVSRAVLHRRGPAPHAGPPVDTAAGSSCRSDCILIL
jgi:hypothetical protein